MPEWLNKWESDGKSPEEIQKLFNEKRDKYIDKWGNKSRVGSFIAETMDRRKKSQALPNVNAYREANQKQQS